MRVLVAAVALLSPALAAAQDLPALYDVVGVAADDVLNIRAKADAGAPIVGKLSPDTAGVEVMAFSADGQWAQVNGDETAGWAALRYLKPENRAGWWALKGGLECSGTEPFWTLYLDPMKKAAHINTPDEEGPELDVVAQWPGSPVQPMAAVQFAGEDSNGVAILHAATCSDGMSDRAFGLAGDIFLREGANGPATALHGCCSLTP